MRDAVERETVRSLSWQLEQERRLRRGSEAGDLVVGLAIAGALTWVGYGIYQVHWPTTLKRTRQVLSKPFRG